jgi:hypothetical protein
MLPQATSSHFLCVSPASIHEVCLANQTDSGHSDQQESFDDISVEEDSQDEGERLFVINILFPIHV